VIAWFSWDGGVCALVNTSDGRGMTDCGLCHLTINEQGEADFAPAGPVDWQALESDGRLQIDGCCVVGDVLCAEVYMGDMRLCFIPLDGSRATVTDARCWEGMVFPCDGGVIAVDEAWNDGTEYIFNRVDVPSGRVTEIARFSPEDGYVASPAQEPGTNRILFVCNGYLTALDPATGETERVASVPIDTQQYCGACAVVLPCGAYAAGGYNGVAVRQVTGRAAGDAVELVVGRDDYWAEPMDNAILAFDRSHPNVTVATVQASQIIERLLTRMEDIDIFVMHTVWGSEASVMDILERGYALELDSSVLSEYVESMYPALRDAFIRNGHVTAVPLEAQAMGISVNLAALEALGLTVDDVPTNWPDFLNFIASLKGNGKVPVVSSWTNALNACYPLLKRLLSDYQLEIQAGRQTSWDTPELRAALEALAIVDFEGLAEEAQALESGWESNPLLNNYDDVAVGERVFSRRYEYYPLRLSISADSPVVMPVMCAVAFVNPASRHPAEATALLEEAVDYVSHAARATLSPAFGEPERDEAAYRRAQADIEDQIRRFQERVNAGDASAEERLASSVAFQREMDSYYWIISPDTLEWYRAHDGDVMLETGGELEDIGLTSIAFDAIENGVDPDALIREIEKKAQMRRLENG
ncbi:MAG: carbohydrate ABC transporter substrate-binding protein, partial [Clostridia bacterium]|nr:carbohydrate ABC transporter substrate-binding protein [Clostridia bacterium]